MILNPVTANQEGNYSVAISNPQGTTMSAMARLAVVRVAAWGEDAYGQSQVPSNAIEVVAIAAGSGHSLALKGDGTVLAWGDNSRGELGQADTVRSRFALPVTGLANVVDIAAGDMHSLALQSDEWTRSRVRVALAASGRI